MVKPVVLPIFAVVVVLLAMQTPINAYGVVRVDVQKNYNYANALGSAISSKLQAWNTFVNSLLQAKNSYKTVTVSAGTGGAVGSTSGTTAVNFAPLYQKLITVNSGVAPAAPPSNGEVAVRIGADEDNEVVSSVTTTKTTANNVAPAVGSTIVTVNKYLSSAPAVSESTSQVASGSGSASVAVSVPSAVSYTYNKRFI